MTALRGLDQWLTREPPEYERVPLRCGACGAFLKGKPDRVESFEEGFTCDGTVRVTHEPYTEGLVAIVGSQFRGKTYEVLRSACGEQSSREPHAPHRVIEVTGEKLHRQCRRCGCLNTSTDY